MRFSRRLLWPLVMVVTALVALVILRPKRPISVDLVRPQRMEMVETVLSRGVVRAPLRTSLAVERLGTVLRVEVEEGQVVEADDLLVVLDDRAARAGLEAARAELAESRARLGRLRATGVELALSSEAEARAELSRSERALARQQRLLDSGAASAETVEEARRARDVAAARLRRSEAEVESASPGGDDLRLAVAGRRRAAASVLAAEVSLAQTRLLAPSPGTVLRRLVEPGAVIQPGAPLIEFMRADSLQIVIEPEEANLASLAVGQLALAASEPFPEQVFEARVARIAPTVDEIRGTVEVWLEVEAAPDHLRPGMTVSVEIEVDRQRGALVLPAEAFEGLGTDAPAVFVERDGFAARREVRVGIADARRVSVVEGLSESEAVVLRPARPLVDGARLRVRGGGS